MNRYFTPIAGLCLLLPAAFAQAEESRDPFQPASWSSKATKSEAKDNQSIANPLLANPLATYILVGLAISKEQAIAVVKAPDTKDYFVKIGDILGKEGGHIESMNSDGITVNMENSIITIPVSNKIEIKTNDQDQAN